MNLERLAKIEEKSTDSYTFPPSRAGEKDVIMGFS